MLNDSSIFLKGMAKFAIFSRNEKRYEETSTDSGITQMPNPVPCEETVIWRTLIGQSKDGIVVLDEEGKVFETNRQFADMIGYPPEEVLGLHVWDWDAKWTEQDLQKMITDVDESGDHFETRHRRRDGTCFNVEISTNGAVIDGRKLVFCICRDISDLKSVQEKLTKNEERFRMLVEGAPDAIYVVYDGCFSYLNSSACKLLGAKTPEQLMGQPILNNIHSSFRDVFQERCTILSEDRKSVPLMESIYLKIDGTEVPVEVSSVPIVYDDKNCGLVFVRDITERKKTEKELKKSKERLSLAMQASAIGFWDFNLDTKLNYLSPEIYAMSGYEPDEVTTTLETLIELTHPEDKETVLNSINRSICEFVPFKIDARIRHKNGTWMWISIKGKPSDFDDNNVPHHLIGTLIDITHRVKAQESILYAKIASDDAIRMRNELINNISHELKTPLNALIGFSEMLIDSDGKMLSKSQCEYLDYINQCSKKLHELVEKMLDFTYVEHGKFDTLEKEEVNTNELFLEILNLLSIKAFKDDIGITTSIDPEVTIIVADRQKLKKILYNLVDNAIKFTENGGTVNLEARKMDNSALFAVSDNGIGIADEKFEIIFEPFVQIDGSIKRKYGGTGLGLPLVKKLVEIHGGSIVVESEIGKGSTFKFDIPLEPE